MALPLPRVVSDVGPGGPMVTSMRGINALQQDNLNNQILGVKAQYAPYTTYADAQSKLAYANMLPYQIRATMLSNPMLWMAMKDNPEAMKGLMNSFAGSIPQGNSVTGNIQLPNPAQMGRGGHGNGLLSMLIDKITGGGQQDQPSVNALTQGPGSSPGQSQDFGANNLASPEMVADIAQNGNSAYNKGNAAPGSPLVPSTQGGFNGVMGQMTAKYNQSPYKEGTLIADPNNPGQFISVPTKKMTSQLQNQLSAAQRTIPQLQTLGDLWKPFMTGYGKAKTIGAGITNLAGLSESELPSQYVDAKMAAFTTVESYLKSIGVPVTVDVQKDLKDMIEPYPGESAKGYSKRIEKETQRIIKDFVHQSAEQLGQGYGSAQFQGQGAQPQAPAPQSPATQALMNSPEAQNEGLAQVDLGGQGQATVQATKNIGGQNYVKINGKWYLQ